MKTAQDFIRKNHHTAPKPWFMHLQNVKTSLHALKILIKIKQNQKKYDILRWAF